MFNLSDLPPKLQKIAMKSYIEMKIKELKEKKKNGLVENIQMQESFSIKTSKD